MRRLIINRLIWFYAVCKSLVLSPVAVKELTYQSLGKFSRRQIDIFSQAIEFDVSCKLSPQETICMKCQSLFSGGKSKKIFQSVVCWFLPSMLSVNMRHALCYFALIVNMMPVRNDDVSPKSTKDMQLTLVMLNKLKCHAHKSDYLIQFVDTHSHTQ